MVQKQDGNTQPALLRDERSTLCLLVFWGVSLSWVKSPRTNAYFYLLRIVVIQLLSHVQLFATRWTAAYQASLSFTISWSLLKLMSIESAMPSNHPSMSSPSPPAFSLSQHQVFTSGGQNIEASALASVLPMNTQD